MFTKRLCALAMVALASTTAVAQEEAATRVAILMFDGVQIIDFAGPYEVFGQAKFDVYTVSADGKAVTTNMNLSVNVDHDFASAPSADILLIPGGFVPRAARDEATLEFARRQSASADHVLSVCTGSFILAATGLLDGKSATTFHQAFDMMARQFPSLEIVRDRRWVDTGRFVTSAGLSSGIDAALHIVGEVLGVERARTVAFALEYDWSPGDREGFIRGRMADQHVRLPGGWALTEGSQMSAVESFGGLREWHTVFDVTSPRGPSGFIDDLRAQANRDDTLSVASQSPGDSVSWQYTDAAGAWKLTLSAPADGRLDEGRFAIVSELVAIDR